MTDIALSTEQLTSSLFLQHLVDNKKIDSFLLSSAGLYSADTPDQSISMNLVMFAEGLNLASLLNVSESLASYLSFGVYSVIQVPGVQGFAIAAKVNELGHTNIKQKIEQVSQQYCVELCLVGKKPSLSEPGLLLMDMDSTVIAVECIDEIASLAGVGKEVAQVTEQAMLGKLDFAQSLQTRVACLENADETIIQQVRAALPLMPGIFNLVKLLKHYNWKLAIASGGFTYFADYLAEKLSLDSATANQLEISEGKLTGKVIGPIIDAQVKADTLLKLAQHWSISRSQTIAMGDGANDLVMMDAAALGVGFHAKPIVREKADMAIRRGNMDSLLWILAAK